MANWDKFNDAIDMKEVNAQIKEAEANTQQYREVPAGQYTVGIDKMEIRPTKDGRPMLSVQFRILDGDFKRSCIFYNRVLYGTKNDGLMIHTANEFLRSFGFAHDDVTFTNYSQYEDLVGELFEDIRDDEFDIDYSPEEFNPITILL